MLTASLSSTKSRVQYSLSNLFEALGVARVSLPRWGWLAPPLQVPGFTPTPTPVFLNSLFSVRRRCFLPFLLLP